MAKRITKLQRLKEAEWAERQEVRETEVAHKAEAKQAAAMSFRRVYEAVLPHCHTPKLERDTVCWDVNMGSVGEVFLGEAGFVDTRAKGDGRAGRLHGTPYISISERGKKKRGDISVQLYMGYLSPGKLWQKGYYDAANLGINRLTLLRKAVGGIRKSVPQAPELVVIAQDLLRALIKSTKAELTTNMKTEIARLEREIDALKERHVSLPTPLEALALAAS